MKDLVVGDLIQLKGGDVIPADAKVAFPPSATLAPSVHLYSSQHLLQLAKK